jgi:hypothetical protein
MTTQEKYRKAIADRPSNEELKYWATLDTRAAEKTKSIFLAELDARRRDRSDQINEIFAKYNREKECKSNGTAYEKWSDDFLRYLCCWYKMPTLFAPCISMQSMYDRDMTAGCAALTYAEECGWETETAKEMKKQREGAEKLVADMDAADKMYRDRIWLAEYKRQRICRSNGIEFLDWKKQFEESVKVMSSLNVEDIYINQILAYYEQDKQAGIAALEYVQQYEPEIPDPAMAEQMKQARKWMADMDKADQLHRARIEAVRCGLVCDN